MTQHDRPHVDIYKLYVRLEPSDIGPTSDDNPFDPKVYVDQSPPSSGFQCSSYGYVNYKIEFIESGTDKLFEYSFSSGNFLEISPDLMFETN